MRRALFRFYVPAGKLARVACAAAGVTLLLCVAGVYAPLVPWLACFAAWWIGKCAAELAVRPLREWQQALPVPASLLSWARMMAPWTLGWTGVVASLAVTGALTLLGVSSHEQWLGALSQALCLIGFIPLASTAPPRLAPSSASSSAGAGLGLLISAGLLSLGLTWKVGAVASAPIGFLVGSLSLLVAFGLALTDGSEAEGAGPRPPVAVARRAWFASAGRRPRYLVVPRFFYFGGRAYFWPALMYAAFFLMQNGVPRNSSVFFWMLTSMMFATMLGTSRLPPLPAHLPVSRDRLLLLTFAPLCLLAVCTVGIERRQGTQAAALVVDARLPPGAASFAKDPRRVRAPSLFWRATLAEPPLVPSLSGEPVHVPSQRVFSGLPLRLYNPFDIWQGQEIAVFNARVSQALRDEWQLDVTDADVEDAYVRPGGGPLGDQYCPAPGLGATCKWPWIWHPIKFCLLAFITWWMAMPPRRSSGAPDRWRRYALRMFNVLVFVPLLALLLSVGALQSYEQEGWTFFAGGVLLGELIRLCQGSPLLACSLGLSLLIALYWSLVRRYRRTELWTRTDV